MKLVLVFCLLFSITAYADVFKCKVGSRMVYQEEPCSNGNYLDLGTNAIPPSPEERAKAYNRLSNEIREVNEIRAREAREEARLNSIREAEARANQASREALIASCESELKSIRSAEYNARNRKDQATRDYIMRLYRKYGERCQ